MLGRSSFHDFRERSLGLAQRDAILRTLGAGDSGFDRSQIQLQRVVEEWRGRLIGAEEHLLLAIGFDESDLFGRARGELQISECFRINREEAHCRAILGGHVGNRGAVGNAQRG